MAIYTEWPKYFVRMSCFLKKLHNVFVYVSPQKAAETEDQQTDSQVVANPEQYIKHPLQNRWE